jgi:hypothetical protein
MAEFIPWSTYVTTHGMTLDDAPAWRRRIARVADFPKPGKLPRVTHSQAYALDYGQAQLQVPLKAALAQVARCGAKVHGATVLIEIAALGDAIG